MDVYIEINGDVEEVADTLAFTLLAKYKKETDTTVVKAFNNDKRFLDTLQSIYGELGEIKTFETL